MKKLLTILLCMGMTLMFTSCATVMEGTSETIAVDSNVKGAKVYIDNSFVGETPFVGTITKGKETKTIKVTKSGYEDSISVINPSVNPVAIYNASSFYFAPFSTTTDYVSGSMWKYDPAAFYVDLTKISE